MEKFFRNNLLTVWACMLLSGCGSEHTAYHEIPNNEKQPVWVTRLPGQAGIYNDGLIGLPVYKNLMLFHSTYFSNQTGEDNRIHALDIETGQLQWTFPKVYDANNPMFFWGVPYLFKNLMVIKMSKWPGQSSSDRIMCLNLDTREVLWKLVLPEEISAYASRDVAGSEDRFYFIQKSKSGNIIYEGNVFNGDTIRIFDTESKEINTEIEITTNDNLLVETSDGPVLHFATRKRRQGMVAEDAWNIFHIITKEISKKIVVNGEDFFSINNGTVTDNYIYFTCGRKSFCYDIKTERIQWEYFSGDDYNYVAPGVLVSENIVFLWGTNRYIGLDARTGRLKYKNNTECANATVFGNRIFLIGRDANLHMIDITTGSLTQTIASHDQTTLFPFATGCKPHIYKDFVYLFGNFNAYCFKINEKLNSLTAK